MPSVDVCIVATRRPQLLSMTLDSFGSKCFPHFDIASVRVNIDPLFGTLAEQRECAEMVMARFPMARICEPEAPNFASAVQSLWAATTGEFVLHMEDDWVALRDIGPSALDGFSKSTTAQVALHTADRNWDLKRRGYRFRRREYARVGPLNIPLFRSTPLFTTSPSFLRGDFARKSASLMNTSLDPEKQFYSGQNPRLMAYAAHYEALIYAPSGDLVIKDTGRAWRDARNIGKSIVDGQSVWSLPT